MKEFFKKNKNFSSKKIPKMIIFTKSSDFHKNIRENHYLYLIELIKETVKLVKITVENHYFLIFQKTPKMKIFNRFNKLAKSKFRYESCLYIILKTE